jgi:hypothetical protein
MGPFFSEFRGQGGLSIGALIGGFKAIWFSEAGRKAEEKN